MRVPRLVPLLLAVALSGCGALSAVSEASAKLDAYTLSPVSHDAAPASGARHLVVELPSAAGAVATDRILVKPLPYQAQYLPDGRWSEPAPALIQTLMVASFQNAGGFRLVGRTGAGLMPDYTLMTDVQALHAEPIGAGGLVVQVAVTLTLIREADRRIVATRRLSATQVATSTRTGAVVDGFDRALRAVLAEAVVWTRAQAR